MSVPEFATIGLIAHQYSDRAVYSLERLIRFLQSQGRDYILEKETARLLTDPALATAARQRVTLETLGQSTDLIIVVGGDGSMLGGARALVDSGVPLLGVNRGRLGFLTDILPDDIEAKVGEVLAGHYLAEDRFLLDVTISQQGHNQQGHSVQNKSTESGLALNDVVLHPGEFIRMLEFEIYVDDHFVTSQRADGIIVSTPTGSTAYALSGGGPILHPRLDAIGLVPMNPHTLSSRPMVVPGNSTVKILVGEHNHAIPQVSCDGQLHLPARPGCQIEIRKKPEQLHLIHPKNHNFYERCRSKLGWGGHLLD